MSQYQIVEIFQDYGQLPDSTGVDNLQEPFENQQDSLNTPQQRQVRQAQGYQDQKRKSKNYGPNSLKTFKENPRFINKLRSKQTIQGIQFIQQKIRNKKGDKVITKWIIKVKTIGKPNCITEMMKLFMIVRKEFTSEFERQEINDMLQDNVEDSIKRKRNRLKKYPQEEAQIKRAIAFYQKIRKMIYLFLFEDNQTLKRQVSLFRQEFFSPAQRAQFHNAGVRYLQSKKIRENQKEIEIEMEEEQLFAVFNFYNQSSEYKLLEKFPQFIMPLQRQ